MPDTPASSSSAPISPASPVTGVARPSRPYLDSLAATVVAALVAAAAVCLLDVLTAVSRGGGAGAGHFAALAIGLHAPFALAAAVAAGVLAGAWRVTFGDGAIAAALRRLRRDRDLDRRAVAALLAAAVVALAFILFAAAAATALVANVQRVQVGALLCGAVLAASLGGFALAALPVYRVTRHVAPLVPPLGPAPAVAVLSGAALLGGAALVALVVFTRLDWRVLDLAPYGLGLLFFAVMGGHLAVWYGPLARVRRRIPRRGVMAAVAAGAMVLVPLGVLRGTPAPDVLILMEDHSGSTRVLLAYARSKSDRDGDGYSAFLGGPDCDDSDPDVHPGAVEIPGDGIDNNCSGYDRPLPEADPDVDPAVEAAAAAAAAARSPRAGKQTNVLMIMVDTVRADRLGVAGYRRDDRSLTPRLDELAARSSYFTRAYAQASNTPRSIPSTFTSLFPSQVAVDKEFKNYSTMLEENLSIFEVLRDAGLHTASFASHFYFREERGVNQGFLEYDNEGALDIAGSNRDIASPRIVPKVEARLAELAEAGTPFAMFVHLFEPHSTYMEHPEFPITERGVPALIQKYDYEIAYVDGWIGRVLDAVKEHGLADDTMIIIFSDHGEAFGIHRVGGQRMFFHGQTLYDELLRVPLIIKLPGVEPATIDAPVMLMDIAPTIVEALGLEMPEQFVGRSLLPAMLGEQMPPRPAYGELIPAPSWNHAAKMMVTGDGRHKIIYRISDRRFEVYDLESDPDELDDLYRSQPELAARLKEELLEWMEVELPRRP